MRNRQIMCVAVFALLGVMLASDASAMLHARMGRFMQRDPAGYVDGNSVYERVRSNPVRYVDSWGYSAEEVNPEAENAVPDVWPGGWSEQDVRDYYTRRKSRALCYQAAREKLNAVQRQLGAAGDHITKVCSCDGPFVEVRSVDSIEVGFYWRRYGSKVPSRWKQGEEIPDSPNKDKRFFWTRRTRLGTTLECSFTCELSVDAKPEGFPDLPVDTEIKAGETKFVVEVVSQYEVVKKGNSITSDEYSAQSGFLDYNPNAGTTKLPPPVPADKPVWSTGTGEGAVWVPEATHP